MRIHISSEGLARTTHVRVLDGPHEQRELKGIVGISIDWKGGRQKHTWGMRSNQILTCQLDIRQPELDLICEAHVIGWRAGLCRFILRSESWPRHFRNRKGKIQSWIWSKLQIWTWRRFRVERRNK